MVVVIINNDPKPAGVEFEVGPLGAVDGLSLVDRLGPSGAA